jgi:hypothetical protein
LNGLSIVTRCGSYALRTFWTLAQVVEDQTRSMASCADDTPLQRCTIPLNQVELARMIGISRTHLSACLLALERAGFLNIHYGSVELMACPLWLVLLNHLHQHGLGDCSQSVEGLMTSLDSLQTTQTNCQQRRLDNTPEGHLPRCETCERRQLMTLRGLISSPRPGH